jgi:capsular exopolysaccharide synthesis family protein
VSVTDQSMLQDARQYWVQLHKQKGIVFTCLTVSLLLAVLVNYTTRPVYQATTQILIDRDTPDVLPNKELVDLVEGGYAYYQTQYQLLRSRALAERAVERLQLQQHPELMTGPMMSPWERVQRLFGRPPRSTVGPNGIPLSPAVAAMRSRILVDPIGGTRLVNLRFNAYDPQVAANAVNALAQLFIEQSLEFRFTTSTEATGWLSERLAEQQAKIDVAEKALQEYSEREGLIDQESRESLVEQKLDSLNAAVLEARTDRISKETVYKQIATLSPARLTSHPQAMRSEALQSLRAELAALREENARLSQTLGDRHPEMVRTRNEIRATEQKLREEARNVARAAESDYRTALARESRLQANLEAAKGEAQHVNRKAFELGALRREVESNRQIYEDLLTKTKQTGLESKLKTTNIRIVEKAETPRAPVKPNKMRNYQLALLFGLLAGVGFALLWENFDNTFKTPDDLRAHLEDVPFLGMVPDVKVGSPESGRMRGLSPTLLISRNAASAVKDAYAVLRTNLIFSSAETVGRELIVTSAGQGEGKTTTLANLALALAYNDAKVLAVDCDLRRPKLHQYFGLEKTPGLSDLIVGKSTASQAIQSTRVDRLQVLSCGYVPPNPAELLGHPMMKQVLDAVRTQYEWVLLDSPPIIGMADAAVLSPLVDGVVILVAAETSSKPAVQRAVDQVRAVGGKVLGVVLNKVDLQRNSYYYREYYGDYYGSYYAEGKGYGHGEAGERRRTAPRRSRPGSRPSRRT